MYNRWTVGGGWQNRRSVEINLHLFGNFLDLMTMKKKFLAKPKTRFHKRIAVSAFDPDHTDTFLILRNPAVAKQLYN